MPSQLADVRRCLFEENSFRIEQHAVQCSKISKLAPNQIFCIAQLSWSKKLFLNAVTCAASFSTLSFGPNFGVVDALYISGCWGEESDKRPGRPPILCGI